LFFLGLHIKHLNFHPYFLLFSLHFKVNFILFSLAAHQSSSKPNLLANKIPHHNIVYSSMCPLNRSLSSTPSVRLNVDLKLGGSQFRKGTQSGLEPEMPRPNCRWSLNHAASFQGISGFR
jgi:hypothetical protein